ncbi:RusA family crossover junction endodeoxyribonuclease [Oxalobacter formigenes]|uniref:RusA family crossover junction endodeoxyribonuclease n=1 Tax=Oxalobacter formigenes TaxID=847 RepID=UPI0022B0170D|nr:RusA family crossover junction endodeoxyribonuclease [Oxalobacter formigenes]WAW06386.1 RusA family crossover junction endodeoxyribonuclease [Oxalobacter formigenes]
MIELTLPYPISANRYWRTYLPRGCAAPVTTVSPEARAYQNRVRRAAREAGVLCPFPGRVAVSYVLYPKRPLDWVRRQRMNPARWDDSVQCMDLDNAQKVLFDAMEGIVYENDNLIRRIEGERAVPDGDARVLVTVEPIEDLVEPVADDSQDVDEASGNLPLDKRFPVNCRVMTPTGRMARVRRYLVGSSKKDHFERLICEYADGKRTNDWVTLQPQFLVKLD